jgi:type IV pilus assembly protein PilW
MSLPTFGGSAHGSPHGSGFHQRGLSLIELMVAMVLGILLVMALAELYVNMARSNQELANTATQGENARFAIQFLENDLVHAGYWGGFVPEFDDLSFQDPPTDVPTAIPDPCAAHPWSAALNTGMLGVPLQVVSGLPGTCDTTLISNKLAGTDVLVVRHAETCVVGGTNCDADTAGRLYLQASNCDLELEDTTVTNYALGTASFTLRERDCDSTGAGTLAAKRRFMQTIYYVRDFAETAGDGIPTLMRSELDLVGGVLAQQPAQVLVPGIERFRVELGIDAVSDTGEAVDPNDPIDWADEDNHHSPTNRGDGSPESFVYCDAGCTVGQLLNTVAVKIHVLSRANQPTQGYVDSKGYQLGGATVLASALDDKFKRHAFSTTVRLYNVSGRRETPPDPNSP